MAQESKTKVVIRKLPPYLKQDGFLEALNKSFEGAYDWVSYYPGKLR
jgi:regulator of nonsense transcripts 3